MRRYFLLSLVVLCAGEARAQGFDAQRFRAASSPESLLMIDRARVGRVRVPGVGLWVHHGADAMLAEHRNGKQSALISGQTYADLTASIAFTDAIEVGVGVPLSLWTSSAMIAGSQSVPGGFGLGDIRLGAKARIAERGNRVDGVRVELGVPTGDNASFRGAGGVSGGLWYIPTWDLGLVEAAVNAGLRYVPEGQFEVQTTGSQMSVGAGVSAPVLPRQGLLSAELAGGLDLGDSGSPALEGLLGVAMPVHDGVFARAGGGVAMSDAFGVPSWRVLAGVYWYPDRPDAPAETVSKKTPKKRPGDQDGDGVPDADDRCPEEPEDEDTFEDGDGCPDPDNDGDEILDAKDKCPLEAEDRDGFKDEDGCPDPDNDGDGVADGDDDCPYKAEDRDKHEDEDGCPDPDNDRDGHADARDRCPDEPEIYNGIKDGDGCPDGMEGDESDVAVAPSEVEIKQRIYFKFGKDRIRRRSHKLLKQVAALLRAHPRIKGVLIEGHADSVGPKRRNVKLSKRRARAVRKFLIRKGVPAERLAVEGYGEKRPVANNNSRRGRALNRRVQFLIVDQLPLETSELKPLSRRKRKRVKRKIKRIAKKLSGLNRSTRRLDKREGRLQRKKDKVVAKLEAMKEKLGSEGVSRRKRKKLKRLVKKLTRRDRRLDKLQTRIQGKKARIDKRKSKWEKRKERLQERLESP